MCVSINKLYLQFCIFLNLQLKQTEFSIFPQLLFYWENTMYTSTQFTISSHFPIFLDI